MLRISDLSTKSGLWVVSTTSYWGPYARDVAVSGEFAYVADQDFGLHVVDISNPSAPGLVSSFATQDGPFGIAVDDGQAYLAGNDFGLFVVDVTDPTIPTLTGTFEIDGSTRNVAVRGNHLFLADNSLFANPIGLRILDVSDPASPTLIGSHETSGDAGRLTIDGNVAYVSSWPDVEALDISDPSSPRLITTVKTTGWACGLTVAGDYLYVADCNGLRIFPKVSSVSIEVEVGAPQKFALHANYPNPFNPTTTISYALSDAVDVALQVYDVLGRLVTELVSETKPPGTYTVSFDATGIPSGVYFYRLQAGENYVETKRMVVVR